MKTSEKQETLFKIYRSSTQDNAG